MQIYEDIITQAGNTQKKYTEDSDLYIIEDRKDPDCKLLKKKIKIKSINKTAQNLKENQ